MHIMIRYKSIFSQKNLQVIVPRLIYHQIKNKKRIHCYTNITNGTKKKLRVKVSFMILVNDFMIAHNN